MKRSRFCITDKGEVLERCPDKEWDVKFPAWQRAYRTAKARGYYFQPLVPCPMPFGHIMFECHKSVKNQPYPDYRRCDDEPAPIWQDNVGRLFCNQRIGWQTPDRTYRYGAILGVQGDVLLVHECGYLDGHEDYIDLHISALFG